MFPSPGNLPNPGIEPRSPALQADSLPAEPQGKPMFLLEGQMIVKELLFSFTFVILLPTIALSFRGYERNLEIPSL